MSTPHHSSDLPRPPPSYEAGSSTDPLLGEGHPRNSEDDIPDDFKSPLLLRYKIGLP